MSWSAASHVVGRMNERCGRRQRYGATMPLARLQRRLSLRFERMNGSMEWIDMGDRSRLRCPSLLRHSNWKKDFAILNKFQAGMVADVLRRSHGFCQQKTRGLKWHLGP
jgi:hypothetical protein